MSIFDDVEERLKGRNGVNNNEFMKNTDITEAVIPSTVAFIGSNAFFGCTALKTVTLPPELTFMGESAFESCEALETIYIPGSLKEIPRFAFRGCFNLKEVVLNFGTETIAEGAFSAAPIEHIFLPDSIKSIDYMAFWMNFKDTLTIITIGSHVSVKKDAFKHKFDFDYKFQKKKKGTYVFVPDGVEITSGDKTEDLQWVLKSMSAEEWRLKGIEFRKQEQYNNAIKAYNKALEIDPNFARVYSNRGYIYSMYKMFDAAIDDFSKAIEISPTGQLPEEGSYYSNRGLIYKTIGKTDLAIKDFKKTLELNPDDSNAKEELDKLMSGGA